MLPERRSHLGTWPVTYRPRTKIGHQRPAIPFSNPNRLIEPRHVIAALFSPFQTCLASVPNVLFEPMTINVVACAFIARWIILLDRDEYRRFAAFVFSPACFARVTFASEAALCSFLEDVLLCTLKARCKRVLDGDSILKTSYCHWTNLNTSA